MRAVCCRRQTNRNQLSAAPCPTSPPSKPALDTSFATSFLRTALTHPSVAHEKGAPLPTQSTAGIPRRRCAATRIDARVV